MKPNWSCSSCGMYSSRRYSVNRHIKNTHNGWGTAIRFVDYVAGVRSGWYPPGIRPSFGFKDENSTQGMAREIEKVYRRRVAEQCLPPVGDELYKEAVSAAKACYYRSTR